MEHLTSRWLLKCLAVPLVVAQVGCAARGVQVAPAPSASSVGDEDRKRCAGFAKREAKSVSTRSVADAAGEGIAQGLMAGLYLLNPGAGMLMAPAFAIGGAIDQSLKNSSARKRAYASAEETCLKPVVLADILGPEHPDVAAAIRNLATGYANQSDYTAAEPLYQRALEIEQRVFGPETAQVATTLELYASLLRAADRVEEAADLQARAEAIWAKAEQRPRTEVPGAAGTTTEAEEPQTARVPQPADEGQ